MRAKHIAIIMQSYISHYAYTYTFFKKQEVFPLKNVAEEIHSQFSTSTYNNFSYFSLAWGRKQLKDDLRKVIDISASFDRELLVD